MTEIHACPPDGSSLTPCCGRTPFELPATDRMTEDPEQVTCVPTSGVTIDGKPAVVIPIAELNALTASRLQAEADRDRLLRESPWLRASEEDRQQAEAKLTAVRALTSRYPVTIDTAHLLAALDTPASTKEPK